MTAHDRLVGELRAMVATRLLVTANDVDADAEIVADLGLESHEIVAFLIEVEEHYPPVVFEEFEAANVRTLRDLAEHIAKAQAP